jgi:hypothetical protein
MTITMLVRIEPIQYGTAARVVGLPLAGHGRDAERAIASLTRGVQAWCHGLQAAGVLEESLRSHGIKWRDVGKDVQIEAQVVPITT